MAGGGWHALAHKKPATGHKLPSLLPHVDSIFYMFFIMSYHVALLSAPRLMLRIVLLLLNAVIEFPTLAEF